MDVFMSLQQGTTATYSPTFREQEISWQHHKGLHCRPQWCTPRLPMMFGYPGCRVYSQSTPAIPRAIAGLLAESTCVSVMRASFSKCPSLSVLHVQTVCFCHFVSFISFKPETQVVCPCAGTASSLLLFFAAVTKQSTFRHHNQQS